MWLVAAILLLGQASPPLIDAAPKASSTATSAATSAGDIEATAAKATPAVGTPTEKALDAASPSAATTGPANSAPAAPPNSWLHDMLHSGALGYMIAGGIFMWPIFALGVIALGVIIERFRALMMLNTRAEALRAKVRELLEADRIEEALNLCDREQGPVPAILGAGLRKYVIARRLGYDPAKIEEQVVKGMDDYSVHIVAAMEKHLPVLATVSSAAPMIGFLGTVQGMVLSFADIVAKHGEVDIVLAAADGIMVSLLTTVLGLVVGIPAFIAFNYFTSVINRFVLDVEESAAELIESVTFQLAINAKAEQDAAQRVEQRV